MKKDKEKKAVKEEEIDPEIAYEKAMEEKKLRNWFSYLWNYWVDFFLKWLTSGDMKLKVKIEDSCTILGKLPKNKKAYIEYEGKSILFEDTFCEEKDCSAAIRLLEFLRDSGLIKVEFSGTYEEN